MHAGGGTAVIHLPQDYKGRSVWLHFNGINYRANIWLNGHKVADGSVVAGAYQIYQFDVTPYALPNDINVLAVETIAQTENDLAKNQSQKQLGAGHAFEANGGKRSRSITDSER
jgi:hypothetical protein